MRTESLRREPRIEPKPDSARIEPAPEAAPTPSEAGEDLPAQYARVHAMGHRVYVGPIRLLGRGYRVQGHDVVYSNGVARLEVTWVDVFAVHSIEYMDDSRWSEYMAELQRNIRRLQDIAEQRLRDEELEAKEVAEQRLRDEEAKEARIAEIRSAIEQAREQTRPTRYEDERTWLVHAASLDLEDEELADAAGLLPPEVDTLLVTVQGGGEGR